jgi:hypothetical protein
MPPRKIELAPALIAKGRYLYEHTDTSVHDIAAMFGISRWTLNERMREWGWARRLYAKGEGIVASAAAAEKPAAATPAVDMQSAPDEPMEVLPFAQRLQRVLDGELAVIERTLRVLGPASNAEAERTTRILAAISRTVQEIQATAGGQTSSDETDDDAVPGDIDEFREELARRIHALVDAEQGRTGEGDDAARAANEPTPP